MDLPGPDVRADRRGEVHAGRRNVAAFRRADMTEHHAMETLGAGLDARTTFDHRHESLVDVFVPAQAREGEHGG
jgi:hypothetical protein